MCAGRYAAATERSGVAAKCLLPGNSTQGFPEECNNGRSFSFFWGGWDYVFSQHIDWEPIPGGRGMPRPYRFPGSGGAGMRRWRALALGHKKKERQNLCLSFLGGDYLLSHFRSTIGVVRLNFSVRNGKRWNPHAVITFVFAFVNRSPAAVIS